MQDGQTLEPIFISALQHFMYCPRQYALIHIEDTFEDNVYTQRGHFQHQKVDTGKTETLPNGVRVYRSLPLYEDELGLFGKSDVVEIHPDGQIIPVEYKQGKRAFHPLKHNADDLQLAAQALCLEYMFDQPVPWGAIFQASSNKRREVEITPGLKAMVRSALATIRELNVAPALPAPPNDECCKHCSLYPACLPEAVQNLQTHTFEHWQLLGD